MNRSFCCYARAVIIALLWAIGSVFSQEALAVDVDKIVVTTPRFEQVLPEQANRLTVRVLTMRVLNPAVQTKAYLEDVNNWSVRNITKSTAEQTVEFVPQKVEVATSGTDIINATLDLPRHRMKSKDEIRIFLIDATDRNRRYESNAAKVPDIRDIRTSVDVDFARGAERIGQPKKDLVNVPLKIDGLKTDDRSFYFRSHNNLFTDSDAIKSRVEFTIGNEWSRSRAYTPLFYEVTSLSNQKFSNSVMQVKGGLRTIPLFRWSRPIEQEMTNREFQALRSGSLPEEARIIAEAAGIEARKPKGSSMLRKAFWNKFIKAGPVPELEIGAFYERRIKQDVRLQQDHAAKDNLVGTAKITWQELRLFPGNKHDDDDIHLQLSTTGWWLPTEKGLTNRPRKLEGQFEAAIMFPLNRLNLDRGFTLKYTTGANPANSYARSSEISFSFNVLK